MGRYQRGNQKGVDQRRTQYNDKKQNDNALQNTAQKTKDWSTNTLLKPRNECWYWSMAPPKNYAVGDILIVAKLESIWFIFCILMKNS